MAHTAGFFRELSPGWGVDASQSIMDVVRPIGDTNEEEIISYLMRGIEIYTEMGAEPDVIAPDNPYITGAGSLLTDGEWVWRSDLAHYVRHHHVALPSEFTERMQGFNYQIPNIEENRLILFAEKFLGMSLGGQQD